MKKNHCTFFLFFLLSITANAQQQIIQINNNTSDKKVIVTADGKIFTTFIYTDTLEKPVLYPIYASDGQAITRGFPISPQPGDPTDHPHHVGLWFDYENVNGLDFWNNSYAIPADKKSSYGWIKNTKINNIENGVTASLSYSSDWTDIHSSPLLKEQTTFYFSAFNNLRIVDRVTTLTAVQNVQMPDAKDGMLGLRVAHALQLPSTEEKTYTDDKGNVTRVQAADSLANGNYITSAGFTGDSAWGTRATWCMLYGKINVDTVSVLIIDHPLNPDYPTYWHARGYGLFAANPLGQKIFSNGKQTMNFNLPKGSSVTFRYRIVINASNQRLTSSEINQLTNTFATMYRNK